LSAIGIRLAQGEWKYFYLPQPSATFRVGWKKVPENRLEPRNMQAARMRRETAEGFEQEHTKGTEKRE